MAKQLSAEEIAEQITGLDEHIRKDMRQEILHEITAKGFVINDDEDTWQAGVDAVVEFIRENWGD